MPHVINGIGTWYYGKRNVHRLRNVCSQCNATADLASYDTTLYFVAFFVPLVPLARKRVLEECPACNRHRVIPLAKWEKIKADAVAGALEGLRADPDDREAILAAIGTATAFQDEPLFDKLSDALAADRTDDAGLQAALGDANGYFARHDRAAEAYMRSLRAEDDPRVREQLGLTLLRLGDPAQAAGCFRHVLEEADGDRLWFLYQLAVAYQAMGMHAEALELLDRTDERFPAAAAHKDWQKLRRVSEKDRGRNRPVGRSPLLEGKTAGTREGSRLGWLLPRLVLPLLLLAFAGWHTWRSVTLAGARPVYLVNGTPRPYTVSVNGTPYQLAANSAAAAEVPEGTVALAPGPGAGAVELTEVRLGSTFWARPYDRTRVVINPDRMAVLVRETTVYSESPPQSPPGQFFTGKPLHEFTGVDHAFEPFPQSVRAKKGQAVTKTRVGLAEVDGAESRVGLLMAAGLPPAELAEYGRRWLAADPDDPLALMWYVSSVPPDAALPALRARLADRPLRAEWHRVYQTTAERTGVGRDQLRGEYRKLLADLPGDPDALYLLARVSDRDESLRLLRQAVAAGGPADRARYALGYRHLCEGDFAAAAAEMEQAPALARTLVYKGAVRDAQLAAGRTGEVLKGLAGEGNDLGALREKARVCEIAGDRAGADAAEAAAVGMVPPLADPALRQKIGATVKAARAAAKGDVDGYLAAAESGPTGAPVAVALLKDDPAAATKAAAAVAHQPALGRGLVLLAAKPADTGFADAKKGLLDALSAGDRDEKQLADLLTAGSPDPVRAIRELLIQPGEKRVLAAAAAVWFPAQKPDLLALSRKLDFHRDEVSLALRKLTGPAAPKAARSKPS